MGGMGVARRWWNKRKVQGVRGERGEGKWERGGTGEGWMGASVVKGLWKQQFSIESNKQQNTWARPVRINHEAHLMYWRSKLSNSK